MITSLLLVAGFVLLVLAAINIPSRVGLGWAGVSVLGVGFNARQLWDAEVKTNGETFS